MGFGRGFVVFFRYSVVICIIGLSDFEFRMGLEVVRGGVTVGIEAVFGYRCFLVFRFGFCFLGGVI